MLNGIIKVFIAATVISLTSWLAQKRPALAGFILALPVSTLLALIFNYAEFNDPSKSVEFAKSIFYAVPLSLGFFIPFLFASQLGLSFGALYSLGLALTFASYLIHRYFFGI